MPILESLVALAARVRSDRADELDGANAQSIRNRSIDLPRLGRSDLPHAGTAALRSDSGRRDEGRTMVLLAEGCRAGGLAGSAAVKAEAAGPPPGV